MTVTYSSDPTAAIGSAASPIERADIGGTCKLNAGTAGTPCTQRSSRLRDDDRWGAAATRQATDRSRLVVGEREAWPEAPVHRARQHLPEHVRQRRGVDDRAQQQRRWLGRDHADELQLHVPGEGERGARGRDLVEQHDPRAQGHGHDLHRRRHALRRQRPDRPLPGPGDHLRQRRHRVRRTGLRGR